MRQKRVKQILTLHLGSYGISSPYIYCQSSTGRGERLCSRLSATPELPAQLVSWAAAYSTKREVRQNILLVLWKMRKLRVYVSIDLLSP